MQDLTFSVPAEQRYSTPQNCEAVYALDGESDTHNKTHIVLGWLLGKNTDPRSVMEARILADVLLDNSSSPLRQALETSELGSAPSPLCGFDNDTHETTFVCGLEGSNPEQAAAVEALILNVITQVAEQGVPQEILESVLHQLELSQREVTGDGFPYGLQLILEALTPTVHHGDPATALDLDALLEPLRQDIKDPNFIKNLARRLLLDNPHRVRLVMAPDTGLSARQSQQEQQRLAQIAATLNAADRQRIQEQAQALQIRQTQEDDPELLPKVTLQDVPLDLKIPEGVSRPVNQLPASWYAQGTNGMVYQQLILDLPELDPQELDLLPLLGLCLPEVGSNNRDYLETQALQAAVTGGISARSTVRGNLKDIQQSKGVMVLAGKALARNQAALAQLMTETFVSPRFDELPRLRELVAQWRAQREQGVTQHGHVLAMAAASAGLSPTAALAQRWDGLSGLQALKSLDNSLDDENILANLSARLQNLHQRLLNAPRQLLVVSEAEQQEAIAASLATHWNQQPSATADFKPLALPSVSRQILQGWSTSTQVNFCARAYPTVAQDHPDAPALQILGDFLRNGYLHRAIREQGGAYGSGAGYHPDSGAFRFFSYRDPRLEETLQEFEKSLDWLHNSTHPARTLEEAILGVIGAIDRPGSPAGEAIGAFFGSLFERTPEQRRAYRQQILEVTLDDLRRVAASYLQPDRASTAVVSHAEALAKLSDWEILTV